MPSRVERRLVLYRYGGPALNSDPLDLVERDLVAGAIVELRRARAGVIGHRLGVFERSAIGEKIRQPRSRERCDSTWRRRCQPPRRPAYYVPARGIER
jgi:hypothetical protein